MANDNVGSAALLQAFDSQVAFCRQPSPFTARLLERSRLWLQRDAGALAALTAVAADPLAAAVPLRWAGALHHLALLGLQPWAAVWPSASAVDDRAHGAGTARGDGDADADADDGSGVGADARHVGRQPHDAALDAALDAAIATAWATERRRITAALTLPPQTNEVQRSAALLPGLLFIHDATGGKPLALLEIGASAGLNLWPERHRYDHGVWQWGDSAAALLLRSEWRGPAPVASAAPAAFAASTPSPLGRLHADARSRRRPATLQIASRAGCDANPVDIRDPAEALRLTSFVWPDQAERLARLAVALAEAARWMADDGVVVQREAARDFVARELARRRTGIATVLLHSVVWQYIEAAEQSAIEAAVLAAGARATADAPLAWLRFEPPSPKQPMELRCRLWPSAGANAAGGDDHLLAVAHPHAAWIEWRGP